MPVAPLSKTHAILNEFIRKLLFGHFADFSSRREQSVSDASHLRTKNPSQLYEHTRTTIHGSACDTARRSRETTRPLRVAPTSPVHTLFLAQSLFRRATQNGSQCSPRPRFTLSRGPVGLLGLSPNRRTPCGRCRVPRQRSYVGAAWHASQDRNA